MMTMYSCDGCRGTAGPMGCPIHGPVNAQNTPMFAITFGPCGHTVLAGWNFCPDCGSSVR